MQYPQILFVTKYYVTRADILLSPSIKYTLKQAAVHFDQAGIIPRRISQAILCLILTISIQGSALSIGDWIDLGLNFDVYWIQIIF